MKEYYSRKREEAVETLSAATGERVEDSRFGVRAALADALRNGTPKVAALAIMAAGTWRWACDETEEEEYRELSGKSGDACAHNAHDALFAPYSEGDSIPIDSNGHDHDLASNASNASNASSASSTPNA